MTKVILQEQHRAQRYLRQSDDVPKAMPLCDGKTDLFFSERTRDMRAAQVICSSCEIQQTCLSDARNNPPFAGVWGGVIFVNGEEQMFKRGRGRPRKSEQFDNARVLKALGVQEIEVKSENTTGSNEPLSRQIA